MKPRKFRILEIEAVPGGRGPERLWQVKYEAIVSKKWKQDVLGVVAKNKKEAAEKARTRFGGKN